MTELLFILFDWMEIREFNRLKLNYVGGNEQRFGCDEARTTLVGNSYKTELKYISQKHDRLF